MDGDRRTQQAEFGECRIAGVRTDLDAPGQQPARVVAIRLHQHRRREQTDAIAREFGQHRRRYEVQFVDGRTDYGILEPAERRVAEVDFDACAGDRA